MPSLPLGDRFALRGKVGLMAWDSDVTGLFFSGQSERFSGEDLLTGVGVEYVWPSGFGLSADYEQLDLDATGTRLGISWRF